MKIKNLKPNEIITTKDFPVRNLHILKIYFRICKKGPKQILPPTPVIPILKLIECHGKGCVKCRGCGE